jgi:hypothetical protein
MFDEMPRPENPGNPGVLVGSMWRRSNLTRVCAWLLASWFIKGCLPGGEQQTAPLPDSAICATLV